MIKYNYTYLYCISIKHLQVSCILNTYLIQSVLSYIGYIYSFLTLTKIRNFILYMSLLGLTYLLTLTYLIKN